MLTLTLVLLFGEVRTPPALNLCFLGVELESVFRTWASGTVLRLCTLTSDSPHSVKSLGTEEAGLVREKAPCPVLDPGSAEEYQGAPHWAGLPYLPHPE